MALSFGQRLEAAKRRGNLRDADLARWLGRRQTTVKGWLEGREPAGPPSEIRELFTSLVKLEEAIAAKKLPVPWMPTARRIAYLARLRGARQDRRIRSAKGTARVEHE